MLIDGIVSYNGLSSTLIILGHLEKMEMLIVIAWLFYKASETVMNFVTSHS
jgi:hypothetical protein